MQGDSKKPAATSSPTPREAELTKEVEDLRAKLAAAEQQATRERAGAAADQEKLQNMPVPQANAGRVSANPQTPSTSETQNKDTRYIVIKKDFTAGQLIPVDSAAPNATERRDAEYRITFKGEQSGKEYPALAVKENAYNEFREGGTYTAQDINQAKLAEPDAITPPAASP